MKTNNHDHQSIDIEEKIQLESGVYVGNDIYDEIWNEGYNQGVSIEGENNRGMLVIGLLIGAVIGGFFSVSLVITLLLTSRITQICKIIYEKIFKHKVSKEYIVIIGIPIFLIIHFIYSR